MGSKLLMILLIVASMLVAYRLPYFLKTIIDPRRSLLHLVGFFLLYSLALLLIVSITAYTIIHFKEFFFKQ